MINRYADPAVRAKHAESYDHDWRVAQSERTLMTHNRKLLRYDKTGFSDEPSDELVVSK